MTLRRSEKPMRRAKWGERVPPQPSRFARPGDGWRLVGMGREWPAFWVPEKDFQGDVESRAHDLGWMTSHAHLPYFDTAGIPDLTMVRVRMGKPRAMFRELKVRDKNGVYKPPKGAQADWLSWMAIAGLDVDVWLWPDDNERINEELSA